MEPDVGSTMDQSVESITNSKMLLRPGKDTTIMCTLGESPIGIMSCVNGYVLGVSSIEAERPRQVRRQAPHLNQ